jgi:hypothetical protein
MRVGDKSTATLPSDSQTGEFTGFSRRRAQGSGRGQRFYPFLEPKDLLSYRMSPFRLTPTAKKNSNNTKSALTKVLLTGSLSRALDALKVQEAYAPFRSKIDSPRVSNSSDVYGTNLDR